ncbi:hypothetical protein HME9302_00183 [Alteripontixanthobacter maritimus]|uniref:Uncharacterized protein n=1 Tax=Alteripontixanthobacter maritimus TaxID=2161824 RepID=A0A369Q774_9SPHN|nr:copper resistance protein NlpE N-terminal domain-containing protein [Alteripontixanthobacter maritimus]RDC59006.1 hypothetical protein HME9302_00183 [Alteripontixanthobacter maritimus]
MRKILAFAALAPAALALTACGGETATDEGEVTTADAEATSDTVVASGDEDFPEVVADARNTVNYAGTYSQTGTDGSTTSLTLNDDGTYTARDAAGMETNGTYNWYSDNSRILIKEGDQNRVYAIADGAIYQLADADTPTDGAKSPAQTYRRDAM